MQEPEIIQRRKSDTALVSPRFVTIRAIMNARKDYFTGMKK